MILPYLATALLILTTVYAAIISFRQKPEASGSTLLYPAGAARTARLCIGIVAVALLIGFITWFSVNAHRSTRRSSRFLIPDGYTGWVRVEFNVPGAPDLPVQDGQVVLKIPPDGGLRTSSPEQYGWANDSYYSYSARGVHRLRDSGSDSLIWGKINGEAYGSSGKITYEEFFVGTKQQFKEQSK